MGSRELTDGCVGRRVEKEGGKVVRFSIIG